MDVLKLASLLHSRESPILEFKQEWYKLESEDKETSKRQKNELIRDILSLANGNVQNVEDSRYLIIGAEDELNENGERNLYDVVLDKPVTAERLLKLVNRVADPPLDTLDCEQTVFKGKNLLVIEIPESPHVHEITERIETPKRPYDEYTVFIRKGSEISTASSQERAILREVKTLKFNEKLNAPPVLGGGVVGATVGGLALGAAGRKYIMPEDPERGAIIGGMAGIILGSSIGSSMGSIYRNIKSMIPDWKRATLSNKVISVFFSAMTTWLFIIIGSSLNKRFISRSRRSEP
jgi:hypothetical protein